MIRLIKTSDLSLHEFEGKAIPEYAILSHRWEEGEISLQELEGELNQYKRGWHKLRQFCQYARENGYGFIWIDTCCIDKKSSAELSESINSMFNWYRRAEICYAYLFDVPGKGDLDDSGWMQILKQSTWFTRGWTLQELLAPRKLSFVCQDWQQEIGSRESLCQEVSDITNIPRAPLVKGWSMKDEFGALQFAVARIMSWASAREVTRIEDSAYSLMGLFRINMPLLYGEGPNAFVRLQLEIMNKYDDTSLFAWTIPLPKRAFTTTGAINRSLGVPLSYPWGGLLAPTIRCFESCAAIFPHLVTFEERPFFQMTSRGMQVEGSLRRYKMSRNRGKRWLLPLNCGKDERLTHRLGLVLAGDGHFVMRVVNTQGFDPDLVGCGDEGLEDEYEHRKVYIPQAWPGDSYS